MAKKKTSAVLCNTAKAFINSPTEFRGRAAARPAFLGIQGDFS
jgi:hypothetical protein